MLNNEDKLHCSRLTDEMVVYLYDESSETARLKFEEHLSDCTPCTDEFACVAQARYSVFEWHKEEFAPLPTPPIVIPYAAAGLFSPADNGFFAHLRGIFTIPRLASALAAVLVTAGLGFYGSNYMRNDEIAVATPERRPMLPLAAVVDETKPDASSMAAVGNDAFDREINTEPRQSETRTRRSVRTLAPARDVSKPLTANVKRSLERDASPNSAQVRKAPVLNNFEESDDRSLRLSDLFDDGGSGR